MLIFCNFKVDNFSFRCSFLPVLFYILTEFFAILEPLYSYGWGVLDLRELQQSTKNYWLLLIKLYIKRLCCCLTTRMYVCMSICLYVCTSIRTNLWRQASKSSHKVSRKRIEKLPNNILPFSLSPSRSFCPDRTSQKFGTAKSTDQQFLCNSETSIDNLCDPEIVKGLVEFVSPCHLRQKL